MKLKLILLLALSSLVPLVFCPAQTVWTGATNSDWSEPGNWTNDIPSEVNDAEISGILSNVVISGATGSLFSLYINQPTYAVTLSGPGLSINTLQIDGGAFAANLPLTMPYESETTGSIIHRSTQDAVFNQVITIPELSVLNLSTTESPTARILLPGGVAGPGGLNIIRVRVVLSVGSTYEGGTLLLDVSNLVVSNTSGSATGSGDVTLAESSQISGTGTISGNVTCESSAMIGANLTTVPGSHVPLHIGGTLTLNSTAINITSQNGAPTAGTYTLVQAGSITGTPVLGSVSLPSGMSALTPEVVGDEIQITITGSPIQGWRTDLGWAVDGSGTNQGNSQDFDGDGYTNLMEYAFNTDPTSKASVPRATASIQNVAGNNRLRISFTRHTERTDINYTVQAATSLAGPWTDIAQSILGGDVTDISLGTFAIDQGTGLVRTVIVTDKQTVAGSPKRFLRVQVVVPP